MKFVKDFLTPVLVLTVICCVVSAALVGVYNLTAPVIEQAKMEEADAARAVVLPGAGSFEAVEFPAEIEGGVDAYKETAGKGYVVTASATGYGGDVKLMVGFDADGVITGIQMIEHAETPGFGAKLAEESYAAGYVGKDSSNYTEVDGIGGATVTSKAYKKALASAFELYSAASGNEIEEAPEPEPEAPVEELVLYTVDEANAALVPAGVTKSEIAVDGVEEIYVANDKSAFTVVVSEVGFYEDNPMKLVVGIDANSTIIGIKPVEFNETPGLGDRAGKASYLDLFIGQTSADGVDGLASATYTCTGLNKAISKALGAFESVKGELA